MRPVRLQILSALILFCAAPAPAVYLVTNNNDSGSGSLRQAALDGWWSGDTVLWSGTGGTINLLSPYPMVRSLIVDGANATSPVTLTGTKEFRVDNWGDTLVLKNLNLGGTSPLIKTGGGRLTLIGVTGTYTGGTQIQFGQVQIESDAALGATSSGVSFGDGTLELATGMVFTHELSAPQGSVGRVDVGDNTSTFTGLMTNIQKMGNGTMIVAGSLRQSFFVLNGRATFTKDNIFVSPNTNSASLFVEGGATVDFANHSQEITDLSGSGEVQLGTATLTLNRWDNGTYGRFDGTITGSGRLVKTNDGIVQFTGNSTYSGGTTVLGGSLTGSAGSFGTGKIDNHSSVTFLDTGARNIQNDLSGDGEFVLYGRDRRLLGNNSGFIGKLSVKNDYGTEGKLLVGNDSELGAQQVKIVLALSGIEFLQDGFVSSRDIESQRCFLTTQSNATLNGTLSGENVNKWGLGELKIGGRFTANELGIYEGTLRTIREEMFENRPILYTSGLGRFTTNNLNQTFGWVYNSGALDLGTSRLRADKYEEVPGSVLETTVAGPNQSGHIEADTVALLTGKLKLRVASGYEPATFSRYVLLTAPSISGRFSEVNSPAAFNFSVDYKPTEVAVTVTPIAYADTAVGSSQSEIARVLDSFRGSSSTDMSKIIDELNVLNAEELRRAFDALSPKSLSTITSMTAVKSHAFTGGLRQRLQALALGNQTGHTGIYDARGKNPVLATLAYGGADLNDLGIRLGKDQDKPGWSLFSSLIGTQGKVDERNGDGGVAPGYDFGTTGAIIGFDRSNGNGTAVGFSAGVQYGHSEIDNDGGKSDVRGIQGGLHLSHRRGDLIHSGYLGGGYNIYDTHRTVAFGTIKRTATAAPTGTELNALYEIAVEKRLRSTRLYPSLGFEYDRVMIDAYTESDAQAINLRVSEQTVTSFRTIAGGWLVKDIRFRRLTFSPDLRLGWEHEWADDENSIEAQFSAGGESFTSTVAGVGRDAAIAGVGFRLGGELVSTGLHYRGEFLRTDIATNEIELDLRVRF